MLLYDFRSPGAQAYVRLAAEMLERQRGPAASPRRRAMSARPQERRLGRGLASLLGDMSAELGTIPPPAASGSWRWTSWR